MSEKEYDQLTRERAEWEQGCLEPCVSGVGDGARKYETESSQIPLDVLYTPLDVKNLDYSAKLGFPGSYPFTRGVDAMMYRRAPWAIHKTSAFGSPKDTAQRLRYLISKGGRPRLGVIPHLPFQHGLDSDHPLARGEVGKSGVAVDSLKDWEDVYEGIPLEQTSGIHIQSNAQSIVAMAMYIALCEKKNLNPSDLHLTVQNDVLKEYFARGTYIFPIKPALKLSIDVIEYCAKYFPTWTPIQLCGIHMRSAGASAVQELAFTMANAIVYIEETLKRGIDIDHFAPRLEMYLRMDRDFFEEIAKCRAARRLWSRLMRERFGAQKTESLALRIAGNVSGHTYTAQQPINNLVRITLEVLAGALGGVQSMAGQSYDEALGLPTEESVVADLRAQQIVAEERGITNTVDPLGGSYFVEALTDRIEAEVSKLLKQVEDMGGAMAAIETGFYKREILKGAVRIQNDIASGARVVVGLNKYVAEKERPMNVFKVDPTVEATHIERLRSFRRNRDNEKVSHALRLLKNAALDDVNLMPATLEAVKDYATIGEICAVLRDVYGEYKH